MLCEDPHRVQRSPADADQPRAVALSLGQIVRLKFTTASQKEWWFTKHSAVRRTKLARLSESQNHRCCYCGSPTWLRDEQQPRKGRPRGLGKWQMATLEHVECQTHGGTDSLWNLVMSCSGCNSARGSLYGAMEFFHMFRGATGHEGRRAMIVRSRNMRKEKAAIDRQREHQLFVLRLAHLFLCVPGMHEYMCESILRERAAHLAMREERRAAQQLAQAA